MRRSFFLFLLYLVVITSKAQSLSEGREIFYDKLTDSYLCSVDTSYFEGDIMPEIHTDGKTINYTFLPIVKISGNFGYEYSEGTVTVAMPEGSTESLMPAKLKWRGGSTNRDGKHKRNYHIKFLDVNGKKMDRKFFGFRKDNSWLLDAAQIDMSRVRNRVAMDIWNDFGHKPYYFQQEPKMRNYIRGRFIELFLDDEYRGIFCMTEAIDRSQLKLKKTDNEGVHGCLWKGSGFEYTSFYKYGDYSNQSETWGSFEAKYPEVEDDSDTDWSSLYDAVQFVADAGYDNFYSQVDEFIDMPVYQDYFLFAQVLNALDNLSGKNLYWACYDKQTDKMITPIPWDLDCTTGQFYNNQKHMEEELTRPEIYYDRIMGDRISYFLYKAYKENNDELYYPTDWTYLEQLNDRYQQCRNDIFSEDSLIARYDHYMDMLTKSGAYSRECARWSGDTDIDGQLLDFEGERAYIHDWIHRRLISLDQQFSNLIASHNEFTGIKEHLVNENHTKHIFSISGMRIADNLQDLPSGIYIVNGKKMIIK